MTSRCVRGKDCHCATGAGRSGVVAVAAATDVTTTTAVANCRFIRLYRFFRHG